MCYMKRSQVVQLIGASLLFDHPFRVLEKVVLPPDVAPRVKAGAGMLQCLIHTKIDRCLFIISCFPFCMLSVNC